MMRWFHALMPKEERFFDLFARHSQAAINLGQRPPKGNVCFDYKWKNRKAKSISPTGQKAYVSI